MGRSEAGMIAFLSGRIHDKSEDAVIINVGGVGYDVHVPKLMMMDLAAIGEPVRLDIHSHTTDAGTQLYGFLNGRDKALFRKLISVSGVGPKMGLAILSGMATANLIAALVDGDVGLLTRVPGIGKKTAERLVIELKDKFKNEALVARSEARPVGTNRDERLADAQQALVSLGYSEAIVSRVLLGLTPAANDSVQTVIKTALAVLGK